MVGQRIRQPDWPEQIGDNRLLGIAQIPRTGQILAPHNASIVDQYIEVGGLGVIWLPDFMAKGHVSRGELVRLFDDWHLNPMPMYVALPPNRRVSAKLRVFID